MLAKECGGVNYSSFSCTPYNIRGIIYGYFFMIQVKEQVSKCCSCIYDMPVLDQLMSYFCDGLLHWLLPIVGKYTSKYETPKERGEDKTGRVQVCVHSVSAYTRK